MERLTIIDLDNSAHHVTRSGELFAWGTLAGLPPTLLTDAAKIKDYRDGLKRPAEIMARIRRLGWRCEAVCIGGAKPRYALVAYRDAQERRVTLGALSGIANLRAKAIADGCDPAELDRLCA